MKKLLLSLALCGVAFGSQAQVWSENFNAAGLPANWVMINDSNTPASGLGTTLGPALAANAWTKRIRSGTTDSIYLSTSWFATAGQADRWLISKSFQVQNANTYLYWDDYAPDANYPDSMQILVSTTAGTTASAFGSPIYNQKGSTGGIAKHGVSLGAYNGQTIRVAFRNNSIDQYLLYVDNAGTEVPPTNDLQLTAIAPLASSPLAYGSVGSQLTIVGAVKNNGYTTVSSYVVKYQQGANTPVSQTFSASIPVYGTGTFTLSTPFTIPSVGTFPIKVWVELSGDAIHTNDTLNTTFRGVSFMPNKVLTFEEATGTWCGWCPRGAVFMDSIYHAYPTTTNLIAVHNADPMTVTAYDAAMTATPGFSGFPGVIVDRREVIDPSYLFTYYNNEKNYFGFADMNFSKPVISGTNLSTTVTVKPALDLSGDYRLALVLTEDDVHGTTTSYDQHNYYSSTNQNLPLSGAGHNWQASPDPIPAAQMYYQFVARAIVPSPTGAAGSLPSSMTSGTNYTYNFNTTLDASWNKNKIRVAVLLIDNSTGNVLNSHSTSWPTAVNDVEFAQNVSIYPNPVNDEMNVVFDLNSNSNVQIEVIDALGRVAMNVMNEKLEAGNHKINVSTSALQTGIYQLRIHSENGNYVEKFTVVK